MSKWTQKTVRVECSGEMHRIVLHRNGSVECPDHGEQFRALAAVTGSTEDARCQKIAHGIFARCHGTRAGLPDCDAVSRIMPLCDEISLEKAFKTSKSFRFRPNQVLVTQWKPNILSKGRCNGAMRIRDLKEGQVAECCRQAAVSAMSAAKDSGLIQVGKAWRIPPGCSPRTRHIAVAVADRFGGARVIHDVGVFGDKDSFRSSSSKLVKYAWETIRTSKEEVLESVVWRPIWLARRFELS